MSIKKGIKKIKDFISTQWLQFITAPFTRTPGLMLCFVAMQIIVPICYYLFTKPHLIKGSHAAACTTIVCESIVITWSVLLVYNLIHRLNKVTAYLLLSVWWFLMISNWLIDMSLLHIYNCSFNSDIAGIIAATNLSESADFVSTYLDKSLILSVVYQLIVFVASYLAGWCLIGKLLKKKIACRSRRLGCFVRYGLTAFILFSWIWAIAAPRSLVNTTNLRFKLYHFCTLNLGHEIVPVHPDLIVDTTHQPQKIVVIIGESHCRSHSSLYGYKYQTQPLQESLVGDSLLFVYKQPVSPGLHTMESICEIIGTHEAGDNKNWYECLTFLEVANIAGYKTRWLSNQSPKGVYDNPVRKIAEFCNEYAFTSDGMRGINSGGYDENILPLIDRYLSPGAKDLTVVHLMGSHVSYSARYPKSFARFTTDDYQNLPEFQRKDMADYDNSVLYNDLVVSSIMKKYADEDAIVFYLSDHAQDLYESGYKYKGHGKGDDPESARYGSAIPFEVYLSPVFQQKHPEVAAKIKSSLDTPVNLTHLIYILMDIMGADYRR